MTIAGLCSLGQCFWVTIISCVHQIDVTAHSITKIRRPSKRTLGTLFNFGYPVFIWATCHPFCYVCYYVMVGI